MINQNGINIDESQKVMKEDTQFPDQTLAYLNRNQIQNNTNEVTNTLVDKPLIPEKKWTKMNFSKKKSKNQI